jgi:hypothetical protein
MDDLRTSAACAAEQSTEVDRIVELVTNAIKGDVRRFAEALVTKRDDELLGPGEFDLRNRVLGMARHMVEATVNDRKKGGTKDPARSVRTAAKTPASSSGGTRRS